MNMLYSTIQSDLYRIIGVKKNWIGVLLNLYKPEFNYLFYLRNANYHFKRKNKLRLLFFRIILRKKSIKYGYEIPYQCDISDGFRLVHYGGIIINPFAKIGKNATIFRGCTIGSNRRGKKCGAPIIGDYVWIGANSAIIGKVTIGNNVMIAPNSYINVDVPSNSICIGNPAKIIYNEKATEFYIDNPI